VRPLLFYTDHYELPLPPGHKFPMRKYRMVRELLAATTDFRFEPAPLADPNVIKLAHAPEYVDAFLNGALSPAAIRRIGFPYSEPMVRRTLASVGSTLEATKRALEHGWGATLAGGTHHAYRDEGSGFCVFNDIAVAIEWLFSTQRIRRAAVLDLDVHQGDGTAAIFAGRSDVLTVSMHSASNFPFRKQASSIDVELPDHTGDLEYLHQLDELLPQVLAFTPDIVFYQAGVDPLVSDTLGKLDLTHAGLMERDLRVIGTIREENIPVVITQGGGYAQPIEDTVEAHANTFRAAAEIFASALAPPLTSH